LWKKKKKSGCEEGERLIVVVVGVGVGAVVEKGEWKKS